MPYMDHKNAERLVNTYADTILRISYIYLKQTYDAQDICQEVFLKMLSRDLSFDSPEHEKAWIIRTTVNACKDHLRQSFYRKSTDLDSADAVAAPPPPENDLMDAVKRLPENERISLILHYYEGYSLREIAGFLGKRENTIAAYLSRARKRLRKMLGTEPPAQKKLQRAFSDLKGAASHE